MPIEIKKSQNPVKYEDAISFMEDRLKDIDLKKVDDLIWVLEHDHIYTSGTSYNENEIIDKSINIIKTNRGGKITYHGPGQLICYFVLDLRKKKDIRKLISTIENTIIKTLKFYNIETFSDKNNIGIWYKDNTEINNPDPGSLMSSLRAFGYSFDAAIADLIDNSIFAKAKNIWIDFY